ncbi:hypothetical protein [Fodinicola feengrottensis]|uniref:FtsX extracellular domain-containing protein n=1 Tax=Fodinicola feengrottensis TaxID=435914 RepID=A0ABN2HR68_9ACTN|nr:hypothetical protein [Fodinicola feengrottensis]
MNPLRRLRRGAARLVAGFRRLAVFSQVLLGLAVVAVLIGGTVVFGAASAPPPSNVDDIDVVRAGPSQGANIAAYLASTRQSLAALSGTEPVLALVSFRDYQTASSAASVLSGTTVKLAFARVPLPGVQTRLSSFPVTHAGTDLAAGMARLATERSTESTQLRQSAATDPAGRTQDLIGADIARREATAYRSGCGCLYAAVISGAPAALRTFASRSAVRAVDPTPQITDPYSAVFTPLLPEQLTTVAPPPDTAG